MQVCATERRLIDRLWIRVKRLPRSGTCAQGTRNEQGAEHPQINNCQKKAPNNVPVNTKTRREIGVESTQLEFLLERPITQRRLDRERRQHHENQYNKRNHYPAYFPLRLILRLVGAAEQATQNRFKKASEHCKAFQLVSSFCFFPASRVNEALMLTYAWHRSDTKNPTKASDE